MNNMNRIGWEKYETPFKHVLKDYRQENKQESGAWSDEEISGKYDVEYSGPVLMTPLGVLPLNESTIIDSQFNFWIMHTNFLITQQVFRSAINVPGVEEFRVLTPYRARLAFAKLFQEDEVKNSLRRTLCGPIIKNTVIDEKRAKTILETKLTYGKTLQTINNLLTIVPSGEKTS